MRVDLAHCEDLGPVDLRRWRDMVRARHQRVSPFLDPAFARAVAVVRPATRVAVTSNDRGEVIGYLAMEKRGRSAAAMLATGLADVQSFVSAPGARLQVTQVLSRTGVSLLTFDHLLAGDEAACEHGWRRTRRARSAVVDLAAGYPAYQAEVRSRSKSLLQSTARKARKLEREHGPVHLEPHVVDHGVLDRLLGWKSSQYRRTGRRDRFADPGNRRLVHDLLDQPVADPFGPAMSVLYAGERVVAAHFGMRSESTLAWWFPAYDPELSAYSPGLVLVTEILRALRAEGLTVLDLGKGDEPYKDRLSNGSIELLEGAVATTGTRGWRHTARTWPGEALTNAVLASPHLRSLARRGLASVGETRTRVERSIGRR